MPAYAAQPSAADTPGTTWNLRPASASASSSSPPRPKTNGSPPLSRQTRLPDLHEAHEQPIELLLRDRRPARRLADADELGVAARVLQELGAHEPVVEHDVGGREQLAAADRDQVDAAGARADEIRLAAPRYVVAAPARERALERALGLGVAAGERVLRDDARDDALPEVAPLGRHRRRARARAAASGPRAPPGRRAAPAAASR